MLTRSLAQEIAQETAAVTNLGILVTDPEGIVLGSSDPKRVGSFHEASVDVVRTRESATHTPEEAKALRGVLPGMTLPIIVGDTVLGTVGISGVPARVRRFGPIVRRQTEMLLRESTAVQSRLLRERALHDLVDDLANYDAELIEPQLMLARATDLGHDLLLRRVVIVIAVAPPRPGSAASAPSLQPELLRTIHAAFPQKETVVTGSTANHFVVLRHVPGSQRWTEVDRATAGECRKLIAAIGKNHGLEATAGIGALSRSIIGLRDSYRDARDAISLGPRGHLAGPVYTIGDLRIPQILATSERRVRMSMIGGELSAAHKSDDWPMLRETILVWCEEGFNLVRGAKALHIHRNTLVLRLARIERLTGRDLRDRRAAISAYIACLADELETSPSELPGG